VAGQVEVARQALAVELQRGAVERLRVVVQLLVGADEAQRRVGFRTRVTGADGLQQAIGRRVGEAVPQHPAAYLLNPDQLNNDDTNFWIFNAAGLCRLLTRAGWQVERFHATGAVAASDPDTLANDERAFCLLRSRRWLANLVLGEGWHEASPDGWRWTARRFTFSLLPGAWSTLTLRLHAPDSVFTVVREIRLEALGLGVCRIGQPGDHELRLALPPGTTRIECELDHCLAPSPTDQRELGIVVTEARYA